MEYQKKQLISGVLWSGIDKLGVVVVQLLLEIILARHLLPQDYGIIGMATIFIGLGILFSESGFSNALIQKQDRNEVDFSTAFYFNLFVSVGFVIIVFFVSPFVADFFGTPILTNVLRVMSISVVLNAIVMVHKTKLSILLDFKKQAKISFLSLIISGVVGIWLAINGYGVWSLVTQIVSQSLITLILFYSFVKWWPAFFFSKSSLAKLLKFGSNVLAAGLIQSLYVNLYNLFIGKKMSASTLGLYTKSNQFTYMPAGLISGILQRVMFPYFSSVQGDNDKIFKLNQNFTRLICIVMFPLFIYLSLFSKPLVHFGLSDKWIEAAVIIRILAISVILFPITVNNMILFQVKNKTAMFLKLEIISKIIGGLILLLTIKHGLLALCYGLLVQQLLQFIITSISSHYLIQKKLWAQIIVILPYILYGGIIYIAVIYLESLYSMDYYKFIGFGSAVFTLFYSLLYLVFLRQPILSLIKIIKAK